MGLHTRERACLSEAQCPRHSLMSEIPLYPCIARALGTCVFIQLRTFNYLHHMFRRLALFPVAPCRATLLGGAIPSGKPSQLSLSLACLRTPRAVFTPWSSSEALGLLLLP